MKDTFDLRKFLTENRLTSNSKILKEEQEAPSPVRDVFEIPVTPMNPEDERTAEELQEMGEVFTIDVEIIGRYHYEDQGIGSYEFWGSPGYHSEEVIKFDEFEADEDTFNLMYKDQVKKWIEDNGDILENKLEQKVIEQQ